MRNLFLIGLLLFCTTSYAQRAMNVAENQPSFFNKPNGDAICYEKQALQKISDQMYQEGNEKYIWVDLMIDGIILSNYNNCIMLFPNQGQPVLMGYTETLAKGDLAAKYYDKFLKFMAVHGYNKDLPIYNFKFQDLGHKQIFDINSQFRKVNEQDLTRMLLVKRVD